MSIHSEKFPQRRMSGSRLLESLFRIHLAETRKLMVIVRA